MSVDPIFVAQCCMNEVLQSLLVPDYIATSFLAFKDNLAARVRSCSERRGSRTTRKYADISVYIEIDYPNDIKVETWWWRLKNSSIPLISLIHSAWIVRLFTVDTSSNLCTWRNSTVYIDLHWKKRPKSHRVRSRNAWEISQIFIVFILIMILWWSCWL